MSLLESISHMCIELYEPRVMCTAGPMFRPICRFFCSSLTNIYETAVWIDAGKDSDPGV